MQKNNDEMEEMAQVVLSTPLESVVPLGGKIRGVVQAFVQGGIKNYKVSTAFLILVHTVVTLFFWNF